jgi:broad specificity phosphatase PhoE
MVKVILVKHSQPEVTAGVPSSRWVLSEEGRARCSGLAGVLRAEGVSRLYSSLEPKALETAALVAVDLGLSVSPRSGLQENDRSGLVFAPIETLRAIVRRFFDAPSEVVMGQESAEAALSRYHSAVRELMADSTSDAVAVVTHGTVLSLLVSRHNPIEPFALWESLGSPSYVVLEGPGLAMSGSVRNPP